MVNPCSTTNFFGSPELPFLTILACTHQAEEAAKKKEKNAKDKAASPGEVKEPDARSASTKPQVRNARVSPCRLLRSHQSH